MIAFSGVTKRYGENLAVDDLTFTVPQGQFLALLGQNGAGKTTTLSILTGCLAPTAGTVKIGGHDLLAEPRQAKRLLGYLPEVPPLREEMTVRGALRSACELKMVVGADIPGHVEEIARQTGVYDVLDRRVGNLSRGYRQRVGLAQALCGEPEVLVLDEPTNGLDPRQTAEFRETLRRLAQGRTVIFSSHLLPEVQALCDRVLILHQGKLVWDQMMRQDDGMVRLRLDAAGEEKKLLPALRALPCVREAKTLSAKGGVVSAELTCAGEKTPQREIFALLCRLNAPILRLQETGDTLEEIFLRATSKE